MLLISKIIPKGQGIRGWGFGGSAGFFIFSDLGFFPVLVILHNSLRKNV